MDHQRSVAAPVGVGWAASSAPSTCVAFQHGRVQREVSKSFLSNAMFAGNHNPMQARSASQGEGDVRRARTLRADELATVAAAAEGLRTREIAQRVYAAERTVEYRLGQAAIALGASNRAHLVATAIRNGLVAARPHSRVTVLTERELVVLEMLSHGLAVSAIAERIGVSAPAISARIRQAKLKTSCKTCSALAALFASYEMSDGWRSSALRVSRAESAPRSRRTWSAGLESVADGPYLD
jgi:DNA-binding NarL/FixJ family response regulator